MEPFVRLTGKVAALDRNNVDTDQIIPKQFLKRIERSGFGEFLFFDWRSAGCSMCLGMNPDIAAPGERVASTSNRNFEGRQGRGGRTHLVSPQVAAATAVVGHFAAPADLLSSAAPADLPAAAPSDPQN